MWGSCGQATTKRKQHQFKCKPLAFFDHLLQQILSQPWPARGLGHCDTRKKTKSSKTTSRCHNKSKDLIFAQPNQHSFSKSTFGYTIYQSKSWICSGLGFLSMSRKARNEKKQKTKYLKSAPQGIFFWNFALEGIRSSPSRCYFLLCFCARSCFFAPFSKPQKHASVGGGGGFCS